MAIGGNDDSRIFTTLPFWLSVAGIFAAWYLIHGEDRICRQKSARRPGRLYTCLIANISSMNFIPGSLQAVRVPSDVGFGNSAM